MHFVEFIWPEMNFDEVILVILSRCLCLVPKTEIGLLPLLTSLFYHSVFYNPQVCT